MLGSAGRHDTLGAMTPPSADPSTPATPVTPEERLAWRAFSEGSQLLGSILDRRLKEAFGISHADYGVLRRLLDVEGCQLPMRSLRHEVWFSRSRLTHQVNRLVADGLLVKSGDATDGRLQVVALTSAGSELVVGAKRLLQRTLREHFFDQLPAGAAHELSRLMTGLVEHLREQPEAQAFRNS
ncbi:hypothetical protein GCM10027062_19220 [Nocardioides hungaricus]